MTKATTHTEVYRCFEGELSSSAPAFWPLAVMEVRAALRRKLPLLILYGPPAIATIAFSFIVYMRYSFLADDGPEPGFRTGIAMSMAERLTQEREIIVQLNIQIRLFALLATSWYGAGLLADDRTTGALQLWLTRPLTRAGYVFGKFLATAFFGLLAVAAPIVVVCAVAAFNSPDWVFLKEDWPLVLRSLAYSLLWVGCIASIVLAASALADRKVFALAGVFGFLMITFAVSGVMHGIYREDTWLVVSPIIAFQSLGEWLLESRSDRFSDMAGAAGVSVGIVTALSLLVIIWRLWRVEVVS